ncbi:hypothetical protein ACF3MZ_00140 [Paenibacillaceae bacterium WGS1546]|uniref:hypothetical protein n=1 Tax=Cohnella sp. WGS1546 TaxID=3366810 RepID=UPI00372D4F44
MEDMYQLCMSHLNRTVRIHTHCGECYEGVIVGVDRENVYLRPLGGAWLAGKKGKKSGKAKVSGWFGPGFGFGGYGYGFGGGGILALSLFTLLAIALI